MQTQTQQRQKLLVDMGAMIVGQLSHPAICGSAPYELRKDSDGYAYRGVAGYRVAQVLLNVGLRNRELASALTPEKLAFFVPWETDRPPVAYIDPTSMKWVTVEAPYPVALQKTDVPLDTVGGSPTDGRRFVVGPDMRGRTVTIPFADIIHVLGAGTTGSGKSWFLKSAAYQASLANVPGEEPANIIILITGKMSRAFADMNGLPGQLGPIAADEESIIRALGWGITEMNRRYEILETTRELVTEPRVDIYFDEFQEVIEDGRNPIITEQFRQLTVKGRECGFHIWATTHKPNLKMFGKSGNAVKGQFSTIVGLRMMDDTSSRVLRGDDTLRYLQGRGDARVLFEAEGTATDARVQMAYVPDNVLSARAGGNPTLGVYPEFQDNQMERVVNRRGRPSADFSDQQLACAIYAAQQAKPLGLPALEKLLEETGDGISGHTKLNALLKRGRRIADYLEDL